MKFSFFKAIRDALFAKLPERQRNVGMWNAIHRNAQKNKALQALAKKLGNERLEAWMQCVQQGYEAKRQLVAFGKGRNTDEH